MVERGWGRFVFATSEIARGTQANPLGAAVFSGVIGLARDLANTNRESGVTFNCYAPGAGTRLFEVYRSRMEDTLQASGVPPRAVGPVSAPAPGVRRAHRRLAVHGRSGRCQRRGLPRLGRNPGAVVSLRGTGPRWSRPAPTRTRCGRSTSSTRTSPHTSYPGAPESGRVPRQPPRPGSAGSAIANSTRSPPECSCCTISQRCWAWRAVVSLAVGHVASASKGRGAWPSSRTSPSTGSRESSPVRNRRRHRALPGVLVMPDAFGISEFSSGQAARSAHLGFIALAGDPYGGGFHAVQPGGDRGEVRVRRR